MMNRREFTTAIVAGVASAGFLFRNAEAAPEVMSVWTNDVDHFVARDRDHLVDLYEDFYGGTMEDTVGDPDEIDNWYRVADDEPITVQSDDIHGPPAEACISFEEIPEEKRQMHEWTTLRTATAQAWAKHLRPGFMSSIYW